MENNVHDNVPNNYIRELRIIEFKIIICISLAYTFLYALIIIILRNYIEKYILLTIVTYIMSLSIFLLIFKVCGGIFYRRNTENRLWYQVLDIDSIYDILSRQHTIVENNIEMEDIENKESSICVICQDSLNDKEKFIKLKCDHKFCIECIAPWCQKKNSCPLCQKTVIENQ
tara:strand:+ start:678 stop:1193 length:516 start_codon:yes stop_codon:yes gene_type:complete